MSQFNQWLNSTIKEKENELQALYLLQNQKQDKQGQGHAAASVLTTKPTISLRNLLGIH